MKNRPTRFLYWTAVLTFAISAAVLLAAAGESSAKTPEDASPQEQRVQMARQAAAVGDVEEAIRIYKDVLNEEPGNDRAFWGLIRVYSSTGDHEDELLRLLEDRIRERPDENQARMELGQAYARVGDHELAHHHWSQILAAGPLDAGRYADIGTLEVRNRMYEQALETFATGRRQLRNDSVFSQELVAVHTALGDFESAIDECMVTVESHGGAVQWATNRIELMLEEGADRNVVVRRIKDVSEGDDATADQLGLAGSVYLVLGMSDRALSSFLKADEVSGGEGTELLEYAALLRDEGLLRESRAAYLMVSERHPGIVSAARAGIAAAKLLAQDGDPTGAVKELAVVADTFPGSTRGAQALFEAARIELDVLKDPAAALATVGEMKNRFGARARQLEHEASLIEIDAYMKQGMFAEAFERSAELAAADVPNETRESAMFARGFASFLMREHDTAVEGFRAMVEENAAGPLVNDALRLMLVIANAQDAGDTTPADLLAEAHAARVKGEGRESRRILLSLADAGYGGAVETEALLMLGAAATIEGDYERAIGHYDRIVAGAGGLTGRAEAMMRKGDVLSLRMNRPGQAMDQYLAILEELPQNILTGEARRKLDRLRRGEGVDG